MSKFGCRYHFLLLFSTLLGLGLTIPQATAEAASVRTLLQPPVIFEDMPVDRYELIIAKELFFNSAMEELRKKGYKTKAVSMSSDSPKESARSYASNGDALVVVSVDHYLDAGFGEDTRMASYLQVYASAKIYQTGSGDLLWQGEGHGTSDRNTTGVSSTRLEISMTAAEVMRTLFKSLPPAGDWSSP